MAKNEEREYLALPTDEHFLTYVQWNTEIESYHAAIYEADAILAEDKHYYLFDWIGTKSDPILDLEVFSRKISKYACLDNNLRFLLNKDRDDHKNTPPEMYFA